MIALCCDSGSQLSPALAEHHRIVLIPLTVTVDGVEYQEGVDLGADDFWAHFDDGTPEVSTAAPAPGVIAETYRSLVERGATGIVSVHTGSDVSGTYNAARLAAGMVDVPVELVDTHSASFTVGLAAIAAAEARSSGADIGGIADEARTVAQRCENVFVVGALDLARRGGRLASNVETSVRGVPILSLVAGQMDQIGEATDVDDAARQMAAAILEVGDSLRVGIAMADPGSVPVADALRRRLSEMNGDIDLLDYHVGPSVGAHTGPGTVGAVYYRR